MYEKKRIELLKNLKAVFTIIYSCESENKNTDCIWLNPKCLKIGNQQLSLVTRKVQRLSRNGVVYKRLVYEAGASLMDEDIVCTHAKV